MYVVLKDGMTAKDYATEKKEDIVVLLENPPQPAQKVAPQCAGMYMHNAALHYNCLLV